MLTSSPKHFLGGRGRGSGESVTNCSQRGDPKRSQRLELQGKVYLRQYDSAHQLTSLSPKH